MAKKNPAAAVVAILLADLVAAGESGTFAVPAAVDHLVKAGHAETNPSVVNDKGEIAVRATAAGIEAQAAATAAAVKEKPKFAIAADIAIPELKRAAPTGGSGGRTSVYPFEELEVGQSFFVADKDGKPAAKSLASTVTGANERFAVPKVDPETGVPLTRVNRKGNVVPDTELTRKFVARQVADGAPWGHEGVSGAGVWRTA